MSSDVSVVYWSLCSIPLVFLAGTLGALLPRQGIRFVTTPTGKQGLTLGLFVFTICVGTFGIQKPEFAVLMVLCGLAVLFQCWGPKRWHRGRVSGAYLFPTKVKAWVRIDEKILVQTSLGGRLLLPARPANQGFVELLAAEYSALESQDRDFF